MELYKHQKEFLDKNPSKHLMCWDTGVGKTLASIIWGNRRPSNLIIVPKHLKKQWNRNLKSDGKSTYVLVTKEEFRRDWDELPACSAIIVDEAHYFSGMKSQLSKNLLKYIKKHKVVDILLPTATPYMSTPWNIYRLAQILGYKWNYWEFSQRFFYHIRMGSRMIPQVRTGIEDEIAELVNRIGSTVKIEECAEIPPQIFVPEFFTLTPSQLKAIKRVREEETNPAVRYTKFHQIENGSLKGDEFREDEFFDAQKHERIMDLVDENKKIAIFARYNLQLELLKKELEAKGKNVLIINGEVKEKDPIVQQAEKSDEVVLLINAACSEGYELPSIGTIVFASLSFSYKDYKQALGRFLRINKLKKNLYIHLVNEGTIDEAVYQSIIRKQDFDIAIYARNEMKDGKRQ